MPAAPRSHTRSTVCVCSLHLCHIPCGTAAYPSVSWPARQSELKMSSIACAFCAQADRQREHLFICLHQRTHTHTTLNLWELCVCVCAPYPKLYNMKKARSKVRTTSFLCSFKARGCILELAGRNPSSNQTSLVTKPPFDCIWFEGIFTAQSREVRTFTRPRAVDRVSVMHLMKNMFSRSTWLLSAYLCQIWDKSFKRSTKEAFTSSYYSNLSSSDGCVLHKRTALACVTATREKATLQGTINSKHNRYTKRERRWGPAAGMLTFQRFVWKSGRGSRL